MYLIVGATGSLGGQVAKQLLARGERVRALVRPESPLRRAGRFTDPNELRRLGAETVEADLNRPETLTPLLAGVDAVLMTASGSKRAPPDTIEAVDVQGARALAHAARRAGVGHLVYLSARGASESAPAMFRSKWEAENAVRASGQPATFLRPALFMQDWIGFVLGAQLPSGRVQLVGEQDPAKAFVDEGDVVELTTAVLLEGPDAHDQARVIEFATDSATHGQVVQRIAKASGMPLTIERLPDGQAITTAPEPVASVLTHLLGLTAAMPSEDRLTPEVTKRYGIDPLPIDGFLARMFAAAAA